MKNLYLSELQKAFPDLVTRCSGPEIEISGFASCDAYSPGDLVFCEDKGFIKNMTQPVPTAIVTTAELASGIEDEDIGIVVATDVKLAHAHFRSAYDDVDLHDSGWARVHETAVIHESVSVPENAHIHPGVIISRNVTIGERVVIQAHAVIEEGAEIGDDSVIHARVFLGRFCQIGKRVRLKPGCVIGAEGFGYARDAENRFHRIPQTGIVVIEDDVVVSANCTIDRATYDETRISRGTKIDALCHIAHNVSIGEDCALVAQTGIAGSSRFGNRVLASGQTGLIDHITVGDDVTLVHRAGLSEDVLEPGMYAGGPVQPFREYRRNISVFKKLSSFRQRIIQLEQAVKSLSANRKDPTDS